MSILKAVELSKTYNERQVVKSVSFEVKSGQTVGILGPNGAGKTTSFYMIIGLVKVDFGSVFLDNVDLSQAPMHQRARAGIGYLPQEASIFKKLTTSDNIMSILEMRKELDKNQRNNLLQSILEDFRIDHIKDSLGMSLSGGERRRVEIARAVAINPKFILFDEPFAGVDPIAVNDIRDIMKKLISKNIGVLITDHNVRETLLSCDYIYIIGNGTVIAEGDTESIVSNKIVRDIYLGKDFYL